MFCVVLVCVSHSTTSSAVQCCLFMHTHTHTHTPHTLYPQHHMHTHAPHTHTRCSHSSVADDVVEHMKLNGPTAVQPSTRHDGSGTKLQEGEGEGEEGVLQVKELLKTEREQRVS